MRFLTFLLPLRVTEVLVREGCLLLACDVGTVAGYTMLFSGWFWISRL